MVPQMEFQNIYLGGEESWAAKDISSIDASIDLAMRDRRLNNVMAQYFPGTTLTCDMRERIIHTDAKPARIDEPDVERIIISLFDDGLIKKTSLDTAIFNLILPAGTVLALGSSNSLNGLGGYHGSTHFQRAGKKFTLYYSANVFSQVLPNGKENGIAVFNRPWKNVVGTLYGRALLRGEGGVPGAAFPLPEKSVATARSSRTPDE